MTVAEQWPVSLCGQVNELYRAKKGDAQHTIAVVRDLVQHKDLERAYQAIATKEDWAQNYLARKSPEQVVGFKEYRHRTRVRR